MAYRFRRKDRSVAHALRRIAREQVDDAVRAIDNQEDVATAIHNVRTHCKKLRGLIRIIRPSFEAYDQENAAFREIGRLLGGLREDTVLTDTWELLMRRYGQIDRRSQLRFDVTRYAGCDLDRSAEQLAEARKHLLLAEARIAGWTLAADKWEAIAPGFMHTLIHARATLDQIPQSEEVDLRHELRKQVKYHWHHLRLLASIAPKEIKPRSDLAAEIADRLGEYHDVAVLEGKLARDPGAFGNKREVEAALKLARRHRTLIEEQCLPLARRLLSERAESVTRRFGKRWSAWRD